MHCIFSVGSASSAVIIPVQSMPAKTAISKMTCCVSSGTSNPTHSFLSGLIVNLILRHLQTWPCFHVSMPREVTNSLSVHDFVRAVQYKVSEVARNCRQREQTAICDDVNCWIFDRIAVLRKYICCSSLRALDSSFQRHSSLTGL